MKRRGFLLDLAAGTAVLAAAAGPYGISHLLAPERAVPERNHLRPPGALKDDATFVAACTGCGLCGEVCPPHCILFHTRDGGAMVNTPYIEVEETRSTWGWHRSTAQHVTRGSTEASAVPMSVSPPWEKKPLGLRCRISTGPPSRRAALAVGCVWRSVPIQASRFGSSTAHYSPRPRTWGERWQRP